MKHNLALSQFILLLLLLSTSSKYSTGNLNNQIDSIMSEQSYTDDPHVNAVDPTAFISRWDTTATNSGSSNADQIRLPLESGTYDFTIDWGDGSSNSITAWDQAEVTHNYTSSGIYTLTITGTLVGWRFGNYGKII